MTSISYGMTYGFEDDFEGVSGKKIRFIATISSEICCITETDGNVKSRWFYLILYLRLRSRFKILLNKICPASL